MQKPKNIFAFGVKIVNYCFSVSLNSRGKGVDLVRLADGLEEHLAKGPHVESYQPLSARQLHFRFLMVANCVDEGLVKIEHQYLLLPDLVNPILP
jgi:hypothetical protein